MITLGGLVGRQVDQLWCPPLLGTGMKPVTNRSWFRLMHYLFKHLQKIQNLNFTSSQTFSTFSNVQTILSIIKRSDDIGWRLKQTTQTNLGCRACTSPWCRPSKMWGIASWPCRFWPRIFPSIHHFFHCAKAFSMFRLSMCHSPRFDSPIFCLCHLIFHVVLPVPLCHLMHVIKRYLKWFSSWATHNERICWMSQ